MAKLHFTINNVDALCGSGGKHYKRTCLLTPSLAFDCKTCLILLKKPVTNSPVKNHATPGDLTMATKKTTVKPDAGIEPGNTNQR
jgi:hypothetical protein